MKTIHIPVINSEDQAVRDCEVLTSRIIGWSSRGRQYGNRNWSPYEGPTTIVSLDSGHEYEIAETLESFRARLEKIVDGPNWNYAAFTEAYDDAQRVVSALPDDVLRAANEQIRWAEALYRIVKGCPNSATAVDAIIKNVDEYQNRHCKNSHFGECLT